MNLGIFIHNEYFIQWSIRLFRFILYATFFIDMITSISLYSISNWFWVALAQEFIDIPYAMYVKKPAYNMKQIVGISLHHIWVLWMYFMLRDTPYLLWHTLTYSLYHMCVNCPLWIYTKSLNVYQKPLHKIVTVGVWWLQVFIPSIIYTHDIMNDATAGEAWIIMLNYWIMIGLWWCGITMIVFSCVRKKYDYKIMISWKNNRGQYEMRNIC